MGMSRISRREEQNEDDNVEDTIQGRIRASILAHQNKKEGFKEGNKNKSNKGEDTDDMNSTYKDYKKRVSENTNSKKKEKKEDPYKWWVNPDGFPDFFDSTLSSLVQLTLYFYLGVNFDLLSKSTQLIPGGLKGQSIDGPPYIGNFQECAFKDNIDIREPISKWTFPYKNSIMCNGTAHRERPLYFRIIYWSVGILAFSYATGRSALNFFLSGSDQTVNVLTGPFFTLLILLLTVIIGFGSSFVGAFTNLDKLLPKCYFTYWFPFLTFLFFLFGISVFPFLITSLQAVTIIYFLLFHIPFVKTEFMEDGTKKMSRGLLTIARRIFTNPLYFFFILVTVAYNAYKHIGFIFASPIIGWSLYYVFQKYSTYLLEDE